MSIESRIDIIIPIYNQKKYLGRCLSSICAQSIVSQIDVTIIDDNSIESYQEIINFFKEYFNIKYIKLNRNRGPGYARQLGLDVTCAPYIIFIDADDSFENIYAVEFLYGVISGEDEPSAVFSSFAEELSTGQKIPHVKDNTWLFGKIYSRDFLLRNNISFNDSRANEDRGFNCAVMLCAQKESEHKIKNVDRITYSWIWNPDSITRRNDFEYKKKDLFGLIENTLFAIEIARNAEVPESCLARQSILTMVYLYFRYLENLKTRDYETSAFLDVSKKFYTESFIRYLRPEGKEEFLTCFLVQRKNFLEKGIISEEDINFYTFERFLDTVCQSPTLK